MGLSDMLGDVYDEDDDAVDPPLVAPPEAGDTPPPLAPEPEPEPVVAAVVEPEPEPVVAAVVEPEPEPVVAAVVKPEPEAEPVVATVVEPEPEAEPVIAASAIEEGALSFQATPGSGWADDTTLDAAFADWQPEREADPVAEDLTVIPIVEEISAVTVTDLEPASELPKPKRRGLFGLGKKKDKAASDLTDGSIEESEPELAPEVPTAKKERKALFGIGKKKEKKAAELPDELALLDLDEVSSAGPFEETLVTVPEARGPMLSDDLLPTRKRKK